MKSLYWSLVFAIIAAEMSAAGGNKYSPMLVFGIAWYGYFVGRQGARP